MKSKNMNYIFNVEYFDGLFAEKGDDFFVKDAESKVKSKNQEIFGFNFSASEVPFAECKEMEQYQEISLYTLYPGLLVGTGNPHEIAVAGALKCGFTFDYVTGLPYITGSTLKGMVRSYFPGERKDGSQDKEYTELVKGILGKQDIDINKLKENMFETQDVYLGAFPVVDEKNKKVLDMEFITPHKEKFKSPNPISLVKVRPAVEFRFSFLFEDYVENGDVLVSADEKTNLCKELLLLAGIGAKTNVGFGKLSENKPQMHQVIAPRQNTQRQNTQRQSTQNQNAPICPKCGKNRCNYNKNTGQYFKTCFACSQKR